MPRKIFYSAVFLFFTSVIFLTSLSIGVFFRNLSLNNSVPTNDSFAVADIGEDKGYTITYSTPEYEENVSNNELIYSELIDQLNNWPYEFPEDNNFVVYGLHDLEDGYIVNVMTRGPVDELEEQDLNLSVMADLYVSKTRDELTGDATQAFFLDESNYEQMKSPSTLSYVKEFFFPTINAQTTPNLSCHGIKKVVIG